jgi:hypothetical protein
MDCWVSFEDVGGNEVTAHRKRFVTPESRFLDMSSNFIVIRRH